MRISDWSSDVCSSDLLGLEDQLERLDGVQNRRDAIAAGGQLAAYYLGRRTLRQDQGHVLVHHRDVFDVEAVLLRKLTQHGGDVVERDLLAVEQRADAVGEGNEVVGVQIGRAHV